MGRALASKAQDFIIIIVIEPIERLHLLLSGNQFLAVLSLRHFFKAANA
jgi:hypothetical protein